MLKIISNLSMYLIKITLMPILFFSIATIIFYNSQYIETSTRTKI
jgi:hypothetical protein